ncbi:MAG: nucleotidyltransferase family protein [Candidatus Acidiferrales bacterium]
MKAFLLAAGLGTRLKPLTDRVPKCLLPIRGVPLLGIWLDLCRQYGINEVLINTHSHPAAVKQYVQQNGQGLEIRVTEEKVLLGSAGTLIRNRKWTSSDSEFWVFYGDVLTNTNLARMGEFHRDRKQLATIGVFEVSNPNQCGIVTVDRDGIVRDFVEKPAKPSSNLAFAGLLLATPAVFDFVSYQIPSDIGFHVLPKLIGRMAAYSIRDYLVDIGTPEKYADVQRTWPGLPSYAHPEDRA